MKWGILSTAEITGKVAPALRSVGSIVAVASRSVEKARAFAEKVAPNAAAYGSCEFALCSILVVVFFSFYIFFKKLVLPFAIVDFVVLFVCVCLCLAAPAKIRLSILVSECHVFYTHTSK